MSEGNYYCPCCGFRGLVEPAYSELPIPPFGDLGDPPYIGRFGYASFECCECCGFEFGYDDDPDASGHACSFRSHLSKFVHSGMHWFRPDRRPKVWSLEPQLLIAGIHQD